MNSPLIPAESARRLLLGAQGLLADPARRATPTTVARLIEQMGFVQLDSINYVERAHHLTLGSRLDDYRHAHLTSLLETRRHLFEHWTHDAAAIPTLWFAHWKPRFAHYEIKLRQGRWWEPRLGKEPEKTLSLVRERIAREGPLRSQDFEHERQGAPAGWWDWKPQKAALEYLWFTGELMVTRRESFQKVYDLTERVLPECAKLPPPSETDHLEWACRAAFERLVIATPKEIADFWHLITLAQARHWCEQAAKSGRIVPVTAAALNGEKPRAAFALADWQTRLRKLPEPPERMRLLSPFDPVIRDRARLARLFDFDYRFEAFVPEAKRRYGYYVLPILEGDQFIGRIDPKFQRNRDTLEIRQVFWEPQIRVTRARKQRFKEALERLANLIGATRIELPA
ncbi:MAG TPA: crosslink repair DNA glycosylase YcaQ family protein [Blastocatellia bacterium]|nr:crosslink repair DNA glycosylase YcaQ family protein [Blastocatellia bacterium]HMX25264.1 crosslink repair DNA glycosylase YcaQ family protein [Blastocatellia bacterium]HMY70350.1 crosslink repair DNA glycosylase YcaQ family protein [Blastocatellia bacterium]HMZ17526.1 crosslink repair DNA glycosylase YcaQ family protein [Blastocatellia bacterium]HNG31351.1 crosslink repair DNA glycosylase YcaQ family protein [Blastocatellia bacterium]